MNKFEILWYRIDNKLRCWDFFNDMIFDCKGSNNVCYYVWN